MIGDVSFKGIKDTLVSIKMASKFMLPFDNIDWVLGHSFLIKSILTKDLCFQKLLSS
eukprot:TRINITY_DN3294_c3_g1_i5.p4 TRINITY_DN3294_c3_g1~~TRINITY_DN3294_c3_g1_i5.p4  ORF type:complete len:57 (+),score=9.94 TRINITY_DN3294_c3_g1_i5:456-626(+)